MVVLKPSLPGDLWPWLKLEGDEVVVNPAYADRHYEPVEAIMSRYGSHEQEGEGTSDQASVRAADSEERPSGS